MTEYLKKAWVYILGAFGLILGLFFWERGKKIEAEGKLAVADNSKDNAVTEAKVQALDEKLVEQEKEKEAKKASTPSDEELLNFLKKQ